MNKTGDIVGPFTLLSVTGAGPVLCSAQAGLCCCVYICNLDQNGKLDVIMGSLMSLLLQTHHLSAILPDHRSMFQTHHLSAILPDNRSMFQTHHLSAILPDHRSMFQCSALSLSSTRKLLLM